MFNKDFSVFMPSNNGERIMSLLSLMGMKKRIIGVKEDMIKATEKIDYSLADYKLLQFVESSKMLLMDVLGDFNDEKKS